MAFNFGSALAQGLMQGTGDALMDHAQQMKREKAEKQKWDNIMNNFKKQSVYSMQMEQVKAQNVKAEQWKAQAGKSVEQIVDENARLAAKGLAPTVQPMFIRDYKKRQQGITKANALANGGYTLPDYSQFQDNPDFQDAIPKAYMTGSNEPDASMSEIYQYSPSDMDTLMKQTGEKVTAYTQKRDDGVKSIQAYARMKYGSELTDDAATYIWKKAGGASGKLEGSQLVDHSAGLLDTYVNSQKFANMDGVIDFSYNIGSTQAPQVGSSMPQYTDTVKQQQETEKKQEAETKRVREGAIAFGKKADKAAESVDAMTDLQMATEGLSKEAEDILFGGKSIQGLAGLTDLGKYIAAKGDLPGAKEARAYLSQLESVVSVIKHDKYGSSQSNTEMANWAKELQNPSILQNPDTLIQQIKDHRQTAVRSINQMSADEAVKSEWLKQHPKVSPWLTTSAPAEEVPETPTATPKTDMSDSSAAPKVQTPVDISHLDKAIQKDINEMVASGAASWDDVRAYMDSLNQQ